MADAVHAYAYRLFAGAHALPSADDSPLPSAADSPLPRDEHSPLPRAGHSPLPSESGQDGGLSPAEGDAGTDPDQEERWERGATALACLGDDVPTALQHLLLGTLDTTVRTAASALARRRGLRLPDQAAEVLQAIRDLESGGTLEDYRFARTAVPPPLPMHYRPSCAIAEILVYVLSKPLCVV